MYAGFLDLSLVFSAGFAGIIVASFFQTGNSAHILFSSTMSIPFFFILIIAILLVSLAGVLNAVLIRKFSFPFYLANLGTITVLYGLAHIYLHRPEQGEIFLDGFSKAFTNFGTGAIGSDPTYSFPISVILSVCICVGIWFVSKRSQLCKKILKNGSCSSSDKNLSFNELLLLFCSATVISSLGGVMQVSYVGFVDAEFGLSFLFDIMAICLLSGFSVFGCKGKFPVLIAGTIIYTASCYAVDFVGLGRFTAYIIRALVIIVNIGLDIHFRNPKVKENLEKKDIM